jgi:hypothetical protein
MYQYFMYLQNPILIPDYLFYKINSFISRE